MAAPVRKAVFPVAGLGTRFLPATKAMPKEMLTVVDRPLIQHVVDEAREAGIEHFIFVTGRNKAVIEDHFDRQFELEQVLAERGKTDELEALNGDFPGPGTTSFTRQQVPLGLVMRSGARATSSATSRSRCCCPTCWCSPRQGLPCPDARRLCRAWRQHYRGRAGARRPGQELRRGQPRR